ncbi:helix-turn-helix transcriptional regulator [Streptomyces bauhiniae]|uniref:helix-turn-helix transcriptional regulator n=1 Tax=Streptomyces bauhiniae TaxID=2340725 RepID=UPI00331736AA
MGVKRHQLVRRRRALGFTQETLAEALGVERSTVRRWESGDSSPLPFQRPRLARLLRVNTEELEDLMAAASASTSSGRERVGYALRRPSGVDLAVAAELRSDMERLMARYDAVPSATSRAWKWHGTCGTPRPRDMRSSVSATSPCTERTTIGRVSNSRSKPCAPPGRRATH